MSSSKRMAKAERSASIMSGEATPWDVVNIFGYALGIDKSVLEYATRRNSNYNYTYCEGRHPLRVLRSACILRQSMITDYAQYARLLEEYGMLCCPQYLEDAVVRLFKKKAANCSTIDDLFSVVQKRIDKILPVFFDEIPNWFMPKFALMQQFRNDYDSAREPLEVWCKRTADSLDGKPYMFDHAQLSSRVLRDDRDLVEELCELYSVRVDSVIFPYDRSKSNRAAHTGRLLEFCVTHKSVTVEIDTENTEVALVIAFLKSIEVEAKECIGQVNVYLTGMEGRSWRHLSEFIESKVVYKEVTRIRAQKSVMDTAIIASVLQSKFANGSGGVLLISSDCDFLVLHEQIPDYPVCYCCARKQASTATLKYLRKHGLPSVYIDYIVNDRVASSVRQEFVTKHIVTAIEASIPNLRDIIQKAVSEVCTPYSLTSCPEDFDRIVSAVCMGVNCDGTVTATIKDESVNVK